MVGIDPYRTTIEDGWIDYNGHLNEAYYLLIFSHATDELIDWMGMHAAFREAEQLSIYTLETHLCYLQEVPRAAGVVVTTRVLDLDDKKVHLFHEMHRQADGVLACTAEMVMASIDMRGPRTAPFPAMAAERLRALLDARRDEPWPGRAGRSVGIRRKS